MGEFVSHQCKFRRIYFYFSCYYIKFILQNKNRLCTIWKHIPLHCAIWKIPICSKKSLKEVYFLFPDVCDVSCRVALVSCEDEVRGGCLRLSGLEFLECVEGCVRGGHVFHRTLLHYLLHPLLSLDLARSLPMETVTQVSEI